MRKKMEGRSLLWAVFTAGILIAMTSPAFADKPNKKALAEREAQLGKEMAAALDQLAGDVQKSNAIQTLQSREITTPATGIVATITELQPCNVSVTDPVEITVEGEMGVGTNEPEPRLFILYIVLRNCSTAEYFLKSAQSIRLSPGSGVCFLPVERLFGLTPGVYQLAAEIRTANADGSETIHATKTCRFLKPAGPAGGYATRAASTIPFDPAPRGRTMESWTSQPVGAATRYVHYVGENRIWLLVDAGWRAYATNDPAVKALIQDAFAAPNGFTVTVWYTEDKADHVQIARTVAP